MLSKKSRQRNLVYPFACPAVRTGVNDPVKWFCIGELPASSRIYRVKPAALRLKCMYFLEYSLMSGDPSAYSSIILCFMA